MIGALVWLTMMTPHFPAKLEWAIEYAESGGNPSVRRGDCRGLWQASAQYATPAVRKNPALLHDIDVGRAEGRRALAGWVKVCGGEMTCALRGYRCGWAGVRGECGSKYAAAVQGMSKRAHWSVEYRADHCRACPECCVR